MVTYIAKQKDIKRVWYLVDATDKILGRLAANIAKILRGKHKPIYTPNIDTGDGVVIINASKIRVTGKKLENKAYTFYSGYPGGRRDVPLKRMLNESPEKVLMLAVKRMLPSGPLAKSMLRKLKIYAGDKHEFNSLKLEEIKL